MMKSGYHLSSLNSNLFVVWNELIKNIKFLMAYPIILVFWYSQPENPCPAFDHFDLYFLFHGFIKDKIEIIFSPIVCEASIGTIISCEVKIKEFFD